MRTRLLVAALALTAAPVAGGVALAGPADAFPSGGSTSTTSSTTSTSTSTSSTTTWDKIAQCESGQRWSLNTGNGYYGGLQISRSTWRAYGGSYIASYPHQATKYQQIKIAEKIQDGQGWGAWGTCSSRLGLR